MYTRTDCRLGLGRTLQGMHGSRYANVSCYLYYARGSLSPRIRDSLGPGPAGLPLETMSSLTLSFGISTTTPESSTLRAASISGPLCVLPSVRSHIHSRKVIVQKCPQYRSSTPLHLLYAGELVRARRAKTDHQDGFVCLPGRLD